MLFSEWAEYDSLKFLDSYLRPGDSFLDVGANVGIFTLLASRHVGSGRLVCIEPGRLQRERLQAHLSLNNIAADVFSYAVSNEEKTISFSTGDAVAHISAATEDTGAKSEEVNARRMDSFIPHQQYQLMKIDVEGFELAALQGASQLIADGHLPVILLELNGSSERYGIPSSEIIALLRKAGYTLGIYRHDQKHFDTTAHLWDDVLAVNEKGLALLKERIADLKIIG